MKQIQKAHSATIPSTILYLDDIEAIISMLNQVAEDVSISDRDFQYDSLENLIKKVGDSPKALTISSRNPYISVRFDRKESITASWLYAEAYHKEAESIFLKLREFLYRKQNWFNHIIRLDVALVLFAALWVIALVPTATRSQWLPDVSTRIELISTVITYLAFATLLRTGMLYSIKLIRRHEKQTFLKQNSGAIILLIIGAIIAEIARWVATLILK